MRGSVRTLSAVLAVAFLMSIATGCQTTKSPREQVDDNAIHTALKAKLTADRFSNIVNIDVNVTNGVVTLAGEVPTDKTKTDAETEAWSVKGVRRVINNLQVSAGNKS